MKLGDINAAPAADKIIFENLSLAFRSKQILVLYLIVASLLFAFDREAKGIVIFILFVCVMLIIERDILPAYPPIMLAAMSVLRLYDSFDTFKHYAWVIVIAVISVIFHFLFYPPRRLPRQKRLGKLFFPHLAVSVALILGGIGSIGAQDYFAPTTLYYVLGLGLGMLGAYETIRYYVNPRGNDDTKEYLSFAMFIIGVFALLMVVLQYAIKVIPALLGPPISGNIIERFFSMSNNVSTVILMVAPFSFYLAAQKKHGVIYFAVGVMQGLAMLLSTSRSGFFFSFALTLPLIIITIYKDRAKRKQYIVALATILTVFFAIVLIGYQKIWTPIFSNYAFDLPSDWAKYFLLAIGSVLLVGYAIALYVMPPKWQRVCVPVTVAVVIILCAGVLIFRQEVAPLLIRLEESRGRMADLAFKNFFRYPLFGTGIGYRGTEEFYQPRPASMNFYHSAPVQILGSMGLIGVLAYAYMLASRIKLLRGQKNDFNFTIYLCTLGLYLMSMVNPGIFVPLMFMLQLTLYYAVAEESGNSTYKIPL